MKHFAPLLLLTLPGTLGALFFGYFTLVDYGALRVAYANFHRVAHSPRPSMPALFIAEAEQNAHRINVFADGTWVLLCVVIAAIGVGAWCVSSRLRES